MTVLRLNCIFLGHLVESFELNSHGPLKEQKHDDMNQILLFCMNELDTEMASCYM